MSAEEMFEDLGDVDNIFKNKADDSFLNNFSDFSLTSHESNTSLDDIDF